MKLTFRHYGVLWVLAALFIAPGLTAYFFYYHPNWLTKQTTNKGQLLNPPLLLASMKKNTLSEKTAAASVLPGPASMKRKQWHLLLWYPKLCEQNCQQLLDKLARIRLALGRHLYEVGIQLIPSQNGEITPPLQDFLVSQDIQVEKVTSQEQKNLLRLSQSPQIYLMTPDNYIILAYFAEAPAKDIYTDLKKLLKKGSE